MMNKTLVWGTILSLFGALIFPWVAFADTLLYQTNTETSDTLRFYRTDWPESCQPFTGIAGRIDYAIVPMKQQEAALSGDIYVQIWTWTGTATSTLEATATMDSSTIAGSMNEYTFTFDTPLDMVVDDEYCLAFTGETPQATGYVRLGGEVGGTPHGWAKDNSTTLVESDNNINIALWTTETAPSTASTSTTDLTNIELSMGIMIFFLAFFAGMYTLRRV